MSYLILGMWGNAISYEHQFRGQSTQAGTETRGMTNGFERYYKHGKKERMEYAITGFTAVKAVQEMQTASRFDFEESFFIQ